MPNPTNVLVPQDGSRVFLAPVGTARPAALTTAIDTSTWYPVGYISDDAPTLNPAEKETSEIRDWLGNLVKIVSSSITRSTTIPLMETSREALRLAFDGGTFSTITGGVKFVPGSTAQERALLIEMIEGESIVRVGFLRAIVSEVGEVTPSAESGTIWEITFTNGDPGDGSDGFFFETNLPGVVDVDLISA